MAALRHGSKCSHTLMYASLFHMLHIDAYGVSRPRMSGFRKAQLAVERNLHF